MISPLLYIILFVSNILFIDSFLPSKYNELKIVNRKNRHTGNNIHVAGRVTNLDQADESSIKIDNGNVDSSSSDGRNILTHEDIVWKLRAPGLLKRLWLRFAANIIRLDCFVFRKNLPTILCPKGGQALLEAYVRDTDSNNTKNNKNKNKKNSNRLTKVGRFGFTTESGAPVQQIQDTVHDIYEIPANTYMIGCAAIIYMYVEPEYRCSGVGSLALEAIGFIHAVQGVDFTVLVADDNGSGKLVHWYIKNGYSKAPKLQDLLGSPNAIHGTSMIAPSNSKIHQDCTIKWW